MDIRPEELPLALLMFAYFFLVITTFWILKPLKKGLFIEFYDLSALIRAALPGGRCLFYPRPGCFPP